MKNVAAIVALVLAGGIIVSAQDGTDWAKLIAGAKISLEDAIQIGAKTAGSGTVFHAELELDSGNVVYSIDVARGTTTCNVVLSASDGKVVEQEIEEDNHTKSVQAAKIFILDAVAAARAKSAGVAVEAQLTLKDGQPIFSVRVIGAGKLTVVKIDGVSGAVLSAEPPKAKSQTEASKFTDTFRVDASEWSATGSNPYFILEPGFFLVLEGKDEGEDVRLTITVLAETKKIDGVETRVVEEREEQGGQVSEVSRNFFAISKKTNSVYYFGEEVDMYKDGKVVSHDGAWLAGAQGARFGLMMPGTPLIGAKYFQEIAPGVAMDRAEIVGLNEAFECPAGKFAGCLKTEESTPLEKGKEHKYYAPGIGLVQDAELKLTKYGTIKKN